MRALELSGFDGPSSLRLAERPEPAPGPGEARVRLRAMSLNHLDVFISRGLPKRPLPAVLGADGAGVIDAVGDGVDAARLGEEVLIYPVITCGTCPACRAGQEIHCPDMAILGEHRDGTLQEAVVVPAANCHRRPSHLAWEGAAALPMTWLTAWRLLFTRGALRAGDALLIVGVGGGVAVAGLLLARARGLRVFVTSRDAAKRERAASLGAELALPSDGYSKAVRDATGGIGVRAVVDTVGPPTIEESLRSLAREGVLLTVGSTAGPKVEILLPRMFFRHLSLVTSTMGTHEEFRAMLRDVVEHQLRPVVDRVFTLDEAPAAFAHLESGAQFGKVVLVP